MKSVAGWPKYNRARTMNRRDIEKGDAQAIARSAFNSLNGARYLLLRVTDAAKGRAWLRTLAPTSLADIAPSGAGKRVEQAIQVAFTAEGLSTLGVGEDVIGRFAPEFVEGMAGDDNRSRRLGDVGANAPANWLWGVGERTPHVLLILMADAARIKAFAREKEAAAQAAGLSAIEVLPTDDMGGLEPFGFVDGVSQPSFDWEGVRNPGGEADRDFTNLIALGELLLGYRNEYGLFTDRPLIESSEAGASMLPPAAHPRDMRDLGLNGSYLVYRQLSQDVLGFWRWVAAEASRVGQTKEGLAEAMVGRRLDGRPLPDLTLGRGVPGVDPCFADSNDFLFDTDPDGLICPVGAHIRRANPRTGDAPGGRQGWLDDFLVSVGLTTRLLTKPTSSTLPWRRNTTVWPFVRSQDDSIASARFHRILRRGREYGVKIDREKALDPATPDPQAGLHFICLNANIGRQFEFIQSAWLASPTFGALTGEQDPLLGDRQPFPAPPPVAAPQRTDGFTRPSAEPHLRRSSAVPPFVAVRGGAYFFLPSLSALRWIARD